MKAFFKRAVLLFVVLALPMFNSVAQTFTNFHNFQAYGTNSVGLLANSDGGNVYSSMVLSGNTLYGTTSDFNTNGVGGIFKINTDGTGFSNFFAFTTTNGGGNPIGGLTLSGNTLYGTAESGGTNYEGSVFAINTDGTGYTNLHVFPALVPKYTGTNGEGATPQAALALSGGMLYGTCNAGGLFKMGTVFAVGIDGKNFTNLLTFNGTNGSGPTAALVVSGNRIYGTTYMGGTNNNGVIFALNTDGSGYSNYHTFSAFGPLFRTNADGSYPHAGMVLSGNALYGTAASGGDIGNGYGTIFTINTDGTGFHTIFHFNFTDGAVPFSGLFLTNNILYGTATEGGANGAGEVFSLSTSGTDFADLHDFLPESGPHNTNSNGGDVQAGVVMSGGNLFGVTVSGGPGGVGTIYALEFGGGGVSPPPITFQTIGGKLVLSWDAPGFTLQSTTALGATFTNVPAATSPFMVSPTNSQEFFRLQQAN